MKSDEPKCFVRNLDGADNSGHIRISQALKQAYKGFWGNNWELVESYLVSDEIPHVLRIIGRQAENKGFEIIEHDDDFESFLNSINITIPESTGLKFLHYKNDILQLATSIFGDPVKARLWLETPIRTLNDDTPIEKLVSDEGKEEVISILYKIKFGEFS